MNWCGILTEKPTSAALQDSSRSSPQQQSYLPLLEGVPGQVSPAGGLEQRDVPPGLNVPLLLQPGQSPRSEEHLQEETLVRLLQHDTKLRTHRPGDTIKP